MAAQTGVIGSGITIRGNLTGSEDLSIEGRLEGTISLKSHLTVETSGVVAADLDVGALTVHGEVSGNIGAADTVVVSAGGRVLGTIRAPRVVIEDGARFKGGIEMEFELPDGVETKGQE